MIILAVHSTTPVLGVAAIEDRRLLGEVVLPPGRQHLENLARSIQDLTAQLQIRLTDVHGLGIAIGPGSFSGTRIGLATIKGIALALGKQVAGASCLDILAWQALEEGERGAAIIDAKRGQVYTALYEKIGRSLALLAEPTLISSDELPDLMAQSNCSILVAADAVQTMPSSSGVEMRSASPSAQVCARLALQRLSRGDADDIHSLHPLYIRRSDAEEKKKVSA